MEDTSGSEDITQRSEYAKWVKLQRKSQRKPDSFQLSKRQRNPPIVDNSEVEQEEEDEATPDSQAPTRVGFSSIKPTELAAKGFLSNF